MISYTIGVFSDSHGKVKNIKKAVELCDDVDIFFHLGDYDVDSEIIKRYSKKTVYAVCGNNDFSSEYPEKLEIEVNGSKIILLHGHQYNYSNRDYKLLLLAQQSNAQAVLYGHSHISSSLVEDDILILNPGSITYPRDGKGNSFAKLYVDNMGKITFDIIKFKS